jgi:methionyl aminopeptidase
VLRSFNSRAPELKTNHDLGEMRAAGRLVVEALNICRDMAVPGTKTIDIDQTVDALYARHGATPLFRGYPGRVPFPAVTCLSLNEQVVHGIPSNRVLKDGDLLKVDTACKLNGWCADRAITIPVGAVRPERLRLLRVAEEVLQIAVDELPRRKYWSEVASRMQTHAERAGFSVVTQYVGHGIGRTMHENPQVPNFVSRETRKHDFRLEPGLVLAVEPMVNMGRPDVEVLRDHWTVVTRDGMPSVHVEHTLALTANGVMVITADEEWQVGPYPPGVKPTPPAAILPPGDGLAAAPAATPGVG